MMEFLEFSLISTFITMAVGFVMWYFSRYDFNFKDIYNEGCDLYKRRQYKAAIAKFKLAIARFPEHFQAYYNMGLCALRLKNYSSAQESFLKALELNKRDVDIIYNLAYTQMCMGNYEKAIENFNIILDSYPDDSDVLFNLGYIEGIAKNYEKAKEFIAKAISEAPEKIGYKRFYLDILEPLFEQSASPQMLDEMLSLSLELLNVTPNDEMIIYKTAVIYAKMGDWENSVNYCERMFSINPNSYKACSQYGLTLFCKGETMRAIEMYERAIKLAPEIPDSYLNLVFAYDKAGDFDSAVSLVEKFIKKFPNDAMVEIAKDYLDRRAEEDVNNAPQSMDSALLPPQMSNETVSIQNMPEDIQAREPEEKGN